MSVDQQRDQIPARRETGSTYFVGRRQGEAAEVYAVSAHDVSRLRSGRRRTDLDWRGGSAARMDLAHILISRVTTEAPSHELEARFALYAVSNLPEDGFVLGSGQIWRWLLATATEGDFLPADPAPRSWAGRLRSLLPGGPREGSDA